jgi:hypothetical protein
VAAEASLGQDGLHILIEIKMLAGCYARLGTMTTRCGHEADYRQKDIDRRQQASAKGAFEVPDRTWLRRRAALTGLLRRGKIGFSLEVD